MPILANYFEDFCPAGKSALSYDAQSFDCMLCLLQSINLSVRLYLNSVDHEDDFRLQPYYERCNVNVQAETIATVVLKNLLLMFPLTPIHQVSEKVKIDTLFFPSRRNLLVCLFVDGALFTYVALLVQIFKSRSLKFFY